MNSNMSSSSLANIVINSNYSLATLFDHYKMGYPIKNLNEHPTAGEIISRLVMQNFGNGISYLIEMDLDLTLKNEKGSRPIFLTAAEGLCGPTKRLIPLYNDNVLHEKNDSGLNVLLVLVSRVHSSCGCLEVLKNHSKFRDFSELNTLNSIFSRVRSENLAKVEKLIEFWITNNYFNLCYQQDFHDLPAGYLAMNESIRDKLFSLSQHDNQDSLSRIGRPSSLYYLSLVRIRQILYEKAIREDLSADIFQNHQIPSLHLPQRIKDAIIKVF